MPVCGAVLLVAAVEAVGATEFMVVFGGFDLRTDLFYITPNVRLSGKKTFLVEQVLPNMRLSCKSRERVEPRLDVVY